MKIDVCHAFTFMLLFVIIYYILQLTDLNIYLNMISEIQSYKFNFYKNEKNDFFLKI